MCVSTSVPRGVAAAVESLAAGRLEGFFEHVSEDVVWTVMGSHPFAGTYRGRDAVLSSPLLPIIRTMHEVLSIHVDHVTVAEPMVVLEFHGWQVDGDGDPLEAAFCWVCRFSSDQIVELRAYVDAGLIWRFMYGQVAAD